MSLSRFLVLTAMYIVTFGVVIGALAAWASNAGFEPFRHHLTAAFRSRAGGRGSGAAP